jgi:hypothetical protein
MNARGFSLVVCCVMSTRFLLAGDTHTDRVELLQRGFIEQGQAIIAQACDVDAQLLALGYRTPITAEVCGMVTNIYRSQDWKDMASRETRKQKMAQERVKAMHSSARQELAIARGQWNAIQEAKYQAWAAAHPDQAFVQETKKRLQSAEDAAHNASWQAQEAERQAQDAQRDARRAQQAASEAQSEADQAQRRSRDTKERADRAEEVLRQNNIQVW